MKKICVVSVTADGTTKYLNRFNDENAAISASKSETLYKSLLAKATRISNFWHRYFADRGIECEIKVLEI